MQFIFTLCAIVTSIVLACPCAAAQEHTGRALEHEATVDAPVSDVWNAFTTKEGIESWMVPHAEIDLRIGGDMRTNYHPDGEIGDENTIVNRIISFEPERMLSIRNVRAPDAFKQAELFQQTWSVVYFESIDASTTRVRTVGMGYGRGDSWDELYTYFQRGNAIVLEALKKHFDAGERTEATGEARSVDRDADAILDLLGRFTGGEWTHESETPDGGIFRVRNVYRHAPDGRSIVMRGWRGDEHGMFEHAAGIVYRDPFSRTVVFKNIDEHGGVATGNVRLEAHDTLAWDWSVTARDGHVNRYLVRTTLESDDTSRFQLYAADESSVWREVVNITYERVAEAPAQFLESRNAHEGHE